jgi:hypothetical protein
MYQKRTTYETKEKTITLSIWELGASVIKFCCQRFQLCPKSFTLIQCRSQFFWKTNRCILMSQKLFVINNADEICDYKPCNSERFCRVVSSSLRIASHSFVFVSNWSKGGCGKRSEFWKLYVFTYVGLWKVRPGLFPVELEVLKVLFGHCEAQCCWFELELSLR